MRLGLRDIDGEVEYDVDTVGETLCKGEREALELVLADLEFERVSVTE